MIEPSFFYEKLKSRKTEFFTGVPDSLLKSFCAYIADHVKDENHIIAANEGAAVGLACGYHIATGYIPLVYMQNSGIGNAVNPLLSLADYDVYKIPLILLIGWRGEPGVKDEPQHYKQGNVTCSMLEAMRIPYSVMSDTEAEIENQLSAMYDHFINNNSPYALVVKNRTFSEYKSDVISLSNEIFSLSREDAIHEVINSSTDQFFISTTGMISRELFELRKKTGLSHSFDFLTVGSMGHASQIAMGIALQKPERNITCLDGDGSLLMHMGTLAVIGSRKPRNFCHIILNNGAHDSVGGQPTVGLLIDIPAIAQACGYEKTYSVQTKTELHNILYRINEENMLGPILIEIRVRKGSRPDLGRPSSTPLENKIFFMEALN